GARRAGGLHLDPLGARTVGSTTEPAPVVQGNGRWRCSPVGCCKSNDQRRRVYLATGCIATRKLTPNATILFQACKKSSGSIRACFRIAGGVPSAMKQDGGIWSQFPCGDTPS